MSLISRQERVTAMVMYSLALPHRDTTSKGLDSLLESIANPHPYVLGIKAFLRIALLDNWTKPNFKRSTNNSFRLVTPQSLQTMYLMCSTLTKMEQSTLRSSYVRCQSPVEAV
jgi:hypothetical protein